MKSISYTFLAAVAAAGLAMGADTATTTPVGYVSLGNQSGSAVPANTDVALSVPLVKASEFTGAVASVSGNTLTVKGTQNWTATQWTSDAAKPYLLYANGGTQDGLTAQVSGSSGSALTLNVIEGNLSALTADTQIKIVPAWTVKTFIAPSSVPATTQLLVFSGTVPGVNVAASQILTSTGTTWAITLGGGGSGDNLIIYPTESLVLRTGNNPVTSLVVSGEVPTFKHRVALTKLSAAGTGQDVRFAYTSPVTQGLLESGLGASNGDQLLIFDNTATGKNKSASQIITYTGSVWVGTFGPGAGSNQNTFQLKGGQGYVFRFATSTPAGSREWVNDQNYKSSL